MPQPRALWPSGGHSRAGCCSGGAVGRSGSGAGGVTRLRAGDRKPMGLARSPHCHPIPSRDTRCPHSSPAGQPPAHHPCPIPGHPTAGHQAWLPGQWPAQSHVWPLVTESGTRRAVTGIWGPPWSFPPCRAARTPKHPLTQSTLCRAGAAGNSTEHIPLGASMGTGMEKETGSLPAMALRPLGGGCWPRVSPWEVGWGGPTPCTHLGLFPE